MTFLLIALTLSVGFEPGVSLADFSEASGFVPAPVPLLASSAPAQEQPLYVYLFTHTEDPFNLDLSEERFIRFVPEVEARAASHPEAGLVWTIEFQGTDAYAVAERNPQTGVLDLLHRASDQGVVEFGYHGHHEATYLNRPQNRFTETTPWEELVTGMLEWVQCFREVTTGNCLAPTGGGIELVNERFGPVQIVTGVFMGSDMAYEGGPSTHAVRAVLPDRLLSFGYPDHGPFASGARRAQVAALMERLTPTPETSSTVFWADNVIKMTDGSPIDGTRGIDPLRGPRYAQQMLAGLDRSRPNVVLTGLASKFLYTKQGVGTSPTIYGYAHPDHPQLPPELLNPPHVKEQLYQQSLQTLDYLLDEVLPANPGSRFINSRDVIQMVAPPDYWTVSPAQLDALARWALLHWTDRPPDWVSDGTDFYSLRDLFALLVLALGSGTDPSANGEINVPLAYGPLQPVDASREVVLSREEIVALAEQLAPNFAPDQPWQVIPRAMVQPTYETSAGTITAAQLLYGMATVYAADFAGSPVRTIRLPATRAMPVTYDLLQEIGCLATCSGTAWSFKPARLRAP